MIYCMAPQSKPQHLQPYTTCEVVKLDLELALVFSYRCRTLGVPPCGCAVRACLESRVCADPVSVHDTRETVGTPHGSPVGTVLLGSVKTDKVKV